MAKPAISKQAENTPPFDFRFHETMKQRTAALKVLHIGEGGDGRSRENYRLCQAQGSMFFAALLRHFADFYDNGYRQARRNEKIFVRKRNCMLHPAAFRIDPMERSDIFAAMLINLAIR